MAGQPANSDIKVYQRVRSYRQMLRHNNVKAMCNHMRPLVMSVPARETQVISTFDGDTGLVQTNLTSNRRGLPIVRYLRPVVSFELAAESIVGLAFPVVLPGMGDTLLENTEAHASDDLQGNLRTAGATGQYR